MKKIITLISLLALSLTTAQAQYYYVPHLNAGTNPGGLNNDIEQPNTTGWTVLQATSATPVWSPAATIPFSFTFNGSAYTSLIASTSGVVSFTTGAVGVPSSTSASLPDAGIPDNSICVWGLAGIGANDQIRTKTFGTAPNRQFWIQYNSYSCIGSTGWTYWAIVLEETSDKIFVVDQRSYLSPLALSIGLQYNSSSALSIPGSPTLGSNATTAADDTPIDNSYFEFITGTQPAVEAELSTVMQPVYTATPGNATISGSITNYGSSPITAFDVKYIVGANTYTDSKSGLNIAFGASYNFTHATPLVVSTPGAYPVKIWIEVAGDANQGNDTLNSLVTGVPFVPVKAVVFEEATGTWCQWCPRGAVYMDSMSIAHPNTSVLIAVHNNDPMVLSAYDAGIGGLIAGYPSVVVNRNLVKDPSEMFDVYDERINDFGYADIALTTTYQANGASSTDISAHFAADLSGDYRFAVVFTEDNLSGTTSAWSQVNAYSGLNPPLIGAGHNWFNEPSPVPFSTMEYDHVARAILGGFSGQSGSLPATISSGSTYNYNFNYTIPASYNKANLHVFGLLIDVANNTILNGAEGTIAAGINEAHTSAYSLSVFPNPANDMATLSFNVKKEIQATVEIIDALGRTVKSISSSLASGQQTIAIDLKSFDAGLYSVKVSSGNEFTITKLVITK
jgi:hypothetical protein